MLTLTLIEIDLVKQLVNRHGRIRTNGRKGFLFLKAQGEFQIPFKDNSGFDTVAIVDTNTIRSLYYDHHLLTRRAIYDSDHELNYTIWEVHLPSLSRYKCFQELSIHHALGTI